jgi:Tfp pilus assembly protein PilN
VSLPLNLARRPLRNERLPTLLLAITCALLGAFTVRHGVVAFELRSGGARDVAGQLVSLERETDELSRQAASLGDRAPVPQQLKEWKTVKQLVDLRAFSWTGLFAALEEVLPPTVRLASVAPSASEGEGTQLTLSAVGRTDDDAVALLKALMGDVRFRGARLLTIGDHEQGVTINCTVRYVGAPARPASRPAESAGHVARPPETAEARQLPATVAAAAQARATR